MNISFKRKLAAFIGIWLLIGIGYSSSFTASWHLDDFPNIVRNGRIHLSQLDYDSVVHTFFASASGTFYRPVPMVSFALNWYCSGAGVFGYHLVNIFIHCINGFLLYLVVLRLLQAPRLSSCYNNSEIHWIAFIVSVMWALNPIQTQAITYIVQRMASMAALFYMAGIYLYLRYKNAASMGLKGVFFVACAVSYSLSVLSKENAILFPFSVILIETIFYASIEPRHKKRKVLIGTISLFLCTLILGFAFFAFEYGNPLHFIEKLYSNRPFTALQRLLTAPRILLFYPSLFIFPTPSRLSLCHDIKVSTSLLEPWTTLPSILFVLAIVGLCIAYYRKKPLISFAIIFYFLNHVVESTILPLELVFEHRNYLPSFFLYLPVAHYIVQIYRRPFFPEKYSRYLTVAAVCLCVGLFCNWTFARNLAWLSEKSLWEDEISKNSQLARPYHNLAWGYYQARGQYEEAMALYRKALTLKAHSSFEIALTLNNMGRIYYLMGEFDYALRFFEKSISEYPGIMITEYQVATTLIQLGRWEEALEKIDETLMISESHPAFLKLKGIALSKIGEDDRAASFFYRCLEQNPNAIDTHAHLSIVLSRMGRFDEAISLFAGHDVVETMNPLMVVTLSEIEKLNGNITMSDKYFNQFIQHQGVEKSREMLLSWKKDHLSVGIDYDHFLEQINQMSEK